MPIKVIYKKAAVILLTVVVLFLAVPVTVFAAPDIDIIYTASTYANVGDTINVTISTTAGASISTLGMRLYYDKEKLTYQRSQWAENLQNSNSSMTLVSDVEYNGSQVLNISMISDGGYQSGNVLVTLVFAVKESYTENPFKLELREITDENLQNMTSTTNIVYQNTGNGSGEETDSPETGTDSSSGNTGSSGSDTNAPADSINSTNTNETATKVPTVNSTNTIAVNNTNNINTATTVASANHPKSFQTGVEDFGTNFLITGVAFGLAGITCFMIRRKLFK